MNGEQLTLTVGSVPTGGIRGGGSLLLGQEQDAVDAGSLDPAQAYR